MTAMNRTTVGVGIIGAGRIFEQHARAYAELGPVRARLLAIADVDEAQLRKATTGRFIPFAYQDYRALLERDDVALVTVCTPPASHERIVIEALEAGKFVMCEKPLAHTLAAADRIIAAARGYPGKLTTVYQFRYLSEVRRARWLRDQGRLGSLLFGRFSRYARFDTPGKPAKPGKASKPGKARADWWGSWGTAGGGVVITQMIHDLDLMCHLMGRPSEVTAVIDTLKDAIESEDTCAATVRFENGALACCYATMTALRTSHAFDVVGESASAHSPWAFECLNTKQREQSLRDALAMFPPSADARPRHGIVTALRTRLGGASSDAGSTATAHTPYIAAVLDAIAEGSPLPIGPEEARTSLELCTAIYASALTGRSIDVPIDHANRYYDGVTGADYDGRQRASRKSVADLVPSGAGR
jgi:UDP-N-acetyl-2-amino-2-deoxyglucuronate dehydrogenase